MGDGNDTGGAKRLFVGVMLIDASTSIIETSDVGDP